MDTIRDMLSVGRFRRGPWYVAFWETEAVSTPRIVATFPREDEAWGVTSLILEYVEKRRYDPQAAIRAALDEYHQACEEEALTVLDNAPAPGELARQDHAHLMGYVS
jgi:hypothetical protein